MLALLIWGLLLAVGAIGWQLSVPDPRRAVFVLVCVLAYCGLWLATWYRRRGCASAAASGRFSWAAAVSLALVLAGWAVWWAAGAAAEDSARPWVWGWLAAGSLGGGVVAGMVSLSDPARRPGKWLVGVSWLLIAAAVVVWILRL